MISIFREFTKSKVFTLLMGLLIASFAVFGLRDVFNGVGDNNVVTAGSRGISTAEFKTMFDRYKQQYPQEHNGQALSNEEFVAQKQHLQMLDQLAGQESLAAWFDKQGVIASAKLVVDQLSQIQAFVNPATGRFDKNTYHQVLMERQLDSKMVEGQIADEIVTQQFGHAAVAGLKSPRIYALAEAALGAQTRDFSYTIVQPDRNALPQPTEADIAAFYKAHLDILTVPETRKAEMIVLSPEQFAAAIPVSDDELHKAYEAQLPTLRVAETRTFVEITAPDMASANAISTALKAGQSPDVVAKANKGTVITYDNKPQSAVSDGKLADAIFKLQSGQVSGPIQGDLGIAVVRMGNINIGSTPSFESVKPKLTADLRTDRAKDQLNKVSHQLADALNAGQDFEATAQKLGLKINPLPDLTQDGRFIAVQNGRQGWDSSYQERFPQVVKAIYALQPGAVSEVEEFGQGQYFALKLVSVKPAAAPPIATLHDVLVQQWQVEKLQASLGDLAQKAADRVNKGEPLAKVAADMKLLPVKTEAGLDRQKAQQAMGQLAGRIFYAKPGEAFQMQVGQAAYLVGRVDATHQPDAATINTQAAMIRPQMARSFAGDLFSLTQATARSTIKPKVYPKLALQALGVSSTDDTKDGDTPKKP
ncbi:peptidyl-prolyl cis-trans isomerase [Asticcacaulis solisilvae]|uniref:peptidyl-prolyl cis-trans isomerase n=1 Tax=Asticcacaulis solisilvae TaxID=1217274 RepID=UPI003FD81E61